MVRKFFFLRYTSFKYKPLLSTTILIVVFATYCLQHRGNEKESKFIIKALQANSLQQGGNGGESNYIAANKPGCQPARKMAFVKTYKCGTTTLMYLILRHTTKSNLTKQEVDPNEIRKGPFNRTFVTNPSVKGDFMFDHIIWNRDEVVAQLGPDVVAFTVLRDPYIVFESYYSFTDKKKESGMDLRGFIELLRKNDPMKWMETERFTRDWILMGLYEHSLAFNLGMPYESLQDDKAIENHIAKIEKEIDLVMITERMEESLVLFRYLMCWQPEDIVVFDKNVRMSSSVTTLSDEDKNELKRWLKADEKLYNHFYKIFEEKVANYPGDIKREMQQRIDAREELRADCLINHEKNPDCSGFNSIVADTRDHLI